MKLWGGRFEAGPSEAFQRFSWSLHFDKRFLEADVRGSQTFARELARAGILSQAERDQLIAAFDQIREEATAAAFFDGAEDEDVHTLVIRKLKEKVGGLADKIHTGRSRNEQVSLDARLWLRGEIDRSLALLTDLAPGQDLECRWRVHQGDDMGRPSVLLGSTAKRSGRLQYVRVGGCCVLVMTGTLDVD